MSAFNELRLEGVRDDEPGIQFKFGERWGHNYRLGDRIVPAKDEPFSSRGDITITGIQGSTLAMELPSQDYAIRLRDGVLVGCRPISERLAALIDNFENHWPRPADEALMHAAIHLAATNVGKTAENPSVGCFLFKAGEFIGAGVTGIGGRPHAEEQALAMAGEAASGATAYVTLEPCGARSKGGKSCSELLVAAGIARVVVACEDPSPYASGQGAERLRAHGVPVEMGLLAAEAAEALGYKPLETRR